MVTDSADTSDAGDAGGAGAAEGFGEGASGGAPSRRSWWGQQLRRPVEEPTHVLAPVLALITFWALAVPGWDLMVTRACLVGWLVLGVLCAMGIVSRLRAPAESEVALWMLMVMPILAVTVIVAAITEAPVRFRFQMSKDDMTRAADTYLNDFRAPLPETIGPFHLDQVTRRGDAVYYVVGGGGSDDQYGFVYRPGAAPIETGRDRFTHLDGNWYLWYSNSPRVLFR